MEKYGEIKDAEQVCCSSMGPGFLHELFLSASMCLLSFVFF